MRHAESHSMNREDFLNHQDIVRIFDAHLVLLMSAAALVALQTT
ncbi:MAG: hypothetical protein WCH04_03900 [Gammaproteobacteria bacterium]